jgi:hypothetical protein
LTVISGNLTVISGNSNQVNIDAHVFNGTFNAISTIFQVKICST